MEPSGLSRVGVAERGTNSSSLAPLSLLWPQPLLPSGHSKQFFLLGEGQGQACKFGERRLLGVLSSGTFQRSIKIRCLGRAEGLRCFHNPPNPAYNSPVRDGQRQDHRVGRLTLGKRTLTLPLWPGRLNLTSSPS